MRLFKAIQSEIKSQLPTILSLRNTPTKKADGSFVTEGDLLVDNIIATAIKAKHPNALIVSEESNHTMEDLLKMHEDPTDVFVVDPIDGTENFKSFLPEWGVSIAHYSAAGKHVDSMLYCPELGIYLDTKTKIKRNTGSRIAGISSSMRIEDLLKVTPGYEYRMFGCCVYSMIQTIRGSFASFENPRRANSWDILAGLNLALQHGLTVKLNGYNYTGEYLPHSEKYSFRIEQNELQPKS